MEELEEEETNNPEQINSAVKCNDDVKDELKRNASSIATAAGIFAGGCTETTFLKDDVHIISARGGGAKGCMVLVLTRGGRGFRNPKI